MDIMKVYKKRQKGWGCWDEEAGPGALQVEAQPTSRSENREGFNQCVSCARALTMRDDSGASPTQCTKFSQRQLTLG